MSDLTDSALVYAMAAHEGQLRKYTRQPYIIHPIAVANLVASVGGTDEMIAAAYLHDTVEDCDGVSIDWIMDLFGGKVARYVLDLTNLPHSAGNRETRHRLNLERLAEALPESKTIKLADLIDNTNTIVARDPHFAPKYLQEKRETLNVLQGGNPHLMAVALALAYRDEADDKPLSEHHK